MIDIHTPQPGGRYTSAVRANGLIFTAGMTPRAHGKLIMTGKIGNDMPLEDAKEAVLQAASNCFEAAKSVLSEGEKIDRAVQMIFMVNAEPDYLYHSKLADYASEFFAERLGEDALPARAAIGLGSLPNNAPLEIVMVFSCTKE